VKKTFVAMSVVIPAYNEAARLPGFLSRLRGYLDREFAGDRGAEGDSGAEGDRHNLLRSPRGMRWSSLTTAAAMRCPVC